MCFVSLNQENQALKSSLQIAPTCFKLVATTCSLTGERVGMRVQLVVKNAGKQQGMVIPVTVRQFVIGREEGCQLRPASDLISKKHCAILIANQGVFVEDFKRFV